jgi:hypothetical protein
MQTREIDVKQDISLLYDNYIPPSVEKILILEKEKGNFSGISYDEIPDIVFAVSVERYIEHSEIGRAAVACREIVREVLSGIGSDISSKLFE